MNETRRRSVARLLQVRPMTVMQISRQFGIPIKLALAEVEHIRRSLRGGHAGEKFQNICRDVCAPECSRISSLVGDAGDGLRVIREHPCPVAGLSS